MKWRVEDAGVSIKEKPPCEELRRSLKFSVAVPFLPFCDIGDCTMKHVIEQKITQ